jgi:hypothetical protein
MNITKKDIEGMVETINKLSKGKNGVVVQRANGWNNLYLIDKGEYKNNHTMLQHLTAGTRREIYEALQHMRWSFWYLMNESE